MEIFEKHLETVQQDLFLENSLSIGHLQENKTPVC